MFGQALVAADMYITVLSLITVNNYVAEVYEMTHFDEYMFMTNMYQMCTLIQYEGFIPCVHS